MAALLNELAELFDEFRTVDLGAWHNSAFTNGARGNSWCRWETGDIDRHIVPVQRASDRNNNTGYPAQEKNRTFQVKPRLSPR